MDLLTFHQREDLLLADYAMRSRDSAGRVYPEPDHPYRGPFQRDRDRIVHSAGFRRLSGKMQVFTGDRGDYHRTRLTHTMEVASVARTMSRWLRLNEDLVEALALLHDVGHPPFGHAGEAALNECLAEHGGFSHNRYALTLVCQLETRYRRFPGLNLSQEILDSQETRVDKANGSVPLLEAQIVDLADSATYNAHDVDDALKLRIVSLPQLKAIPLVQEAIKTAGLEGQTDGQATSLLRGEITRALINLQVNDALTHCWPVLQRCNSLSAAEAQAAGVRLTFSLEMHELRRSLEQFLYTEVYRHHDLMQVRQEAQDRIKASHAYYRDHIDSLPLQFRSRATQVGPDVAAADYLAGMTDRFFQQDYERLMVDNRAG